MTTTTDDERFARLTANIVSAYVKNNQVEGSQLASIIDSVHTSLIRLSAVAPDENTTPQKPAVPIKKSVTPEYIVCLEDGKRFKFLKRHLSAAFGMTPAEYRAKWKLPPTYPMIAPNYASPRSRLVSHISPHIPANDMIDDDIDEQVEAKPAPAPRKAKAAAPKRAPRKGS